MTVAGSHAMRAANGVGTVVDAGLYTHTWGVREDRKRDLGPSVVTAPPVR